MCYHRYYLESFQHIFSMSGPPKHFLKDKLWHFSLKLVSAIFYRIFIFHQMIALKKCFLKKCFLFHLKNSFLSWDIQIFVSLSSSLFFPVSHCFGGWFKKTHKVYDVINCLNKNLKILFAWYLEKEIKCDIETLPIDKALNTENFHGKTMQKMCTKS